MKTSKPLLLVASCCLLAAVCGKSGGSNSSTNSGGTNSGASTGSGGGQAAGGPRSAAGPSQPELPATLTDVNLAAADMGGAVEQLSANYDTEHPDYGPGLLGRRLVDGLSGPTWFTPKDWHQNRIYNKDSGWAKFPVDVVRTFN